MLESLFTKLFGNKHARDVKRITPQVDEINTYYQQYHELTDDELRYKTIEFKRAIHNRVAEIQSQIYDLQQKLREDIELDESVDPEKIRDEIKELAKEEQEAGEEIMSEILPQAFAVVKEACRRLVGKSWSVSDIETTWEMVPFDVQLIGGIVLHEGKISEMATGEGKTLVPPCHSI